MITPSRRFYLQIIWMQRVHVLCDVIYDGTDSTIFHLPNRHRFTTFVNKGSMLSQVVATLLRRGILPSSASLNSSERQTIIGDTHNAQTKNTKGFLRKFWPTLNLTKSRDRMSSENEGICVRTGKTDGAMPFDLNLIDEIVCPTMNSLPDLSDQYPLVNCGEFRRRALIVYNTKNRYGAKDEASYLQEQLKLLDFEIEKCVNFKAEEFLEELKNFCEKNAKTTSILVVVIMSHGSWGRVHDQDDRWININEIQEPMTQISPNIPKVLIVQACQGGLHKNSRDYDGRPPVAAPVAAPVTARSTDVHMLDVDMAVIMSTLWSQISARQFFIPILCDVLKEAATEPMEIFDIYRKVCSIMTGPERMDYVNRPLKDESVSHSTPVRYAVGEPSRQKVMQIPCMLSTLRKPLIIGRYSSDSRI